ncbi:MAG: glycosyltransferase family A protein [Candidatus Sulfotelmatobacter sp.]
MSSETNKLTYVLITPCRNEARLIEETIQSVVAQTILPLRWLIVNDGSTDATAEIVTNYAVQHSWIELVSLPARKERNFAGKVHAFNEGLKRVQDLRFELIGNLDADISFGADHFEFLISKFADNLELGVAGTAYTQDGGWDSTRDSFEGENSVHGACQLFRYKCFLDIGGYCASRLGGVDWIAVTTARMKGWETRNYPDRRYYHPRTMGTAEKGPLGAAFDYGRKDYLLGGSPVWELCRVAYQMTKRPVFLRGTALLFGFCMAAVRRMERPVSRDLMRFHRGEQMKKLRMILGSMVKLRRVRTYLPSVPVK